ncbi:MAG: enoyl-CoA hydratase-related protein, partial [Pseudomonadota bacterium]
AEADAAIGLPESNFGMYPGMGALSFLSRRIGRKKAEKLISTGKILTGQEAFEQGLVDEVCPPGEVDAHIDAYIKTQELKPRLSAFFRAGRAYYEHITKEELLDLVYRWAEAALTLNDKEIYIMERLLARQQKRADREKAEAAPQSAEVHPLNKDAMLPGTTNPYR